MKNIVVVLFIIISVSILSFFYYFYKDQNAKNTITPNSQTTQTQEGKPEAQSVIENKPTEQSNNAKNLPLEEIAKHNTPADCWTVIDKKVYDLSKYIESAIHPGENEAIIQYCGKDGTSGYNTKDKRRPQEHSANAHDELTTYFVGDLSSK